MGGCALEEEGRGVCVEGSVEGKGYGWESGG